MRQSPPGRGCANGHGPRLRSASLVSLLADIAALVPTLPSIGARSTTPGKFNGRIPGWLYLLALGGPDFIACRRATTGGRNLSRFYELIKLRQEPLSQSCLAPRVAMRWGNHEHRAVWSGICKAGRYRSLVFGQVPRLRALPFGGGRAGADPCGVGRVDDDAVRSRCSRGGRRGGKRTGAPGD